MKSIYRYILESVASGGITKQAGVHLSKILKEYDAKSERHSGDIAIIGIGAKLPMAENVEEFWANIRNGKDCITEFPWQRKSDMEIYLQNKNIPKEKTNYMLGAYLDEVDKFDYSFFKLTPKEASLMDPCQRLFLETAWTAIEDSGYGGEKLAGSKTGIYVGYSSNMKFSYTQIISAFDPESLSMSVPGNLPSIIPSRLSYILDFRGPSLLIDTACSSSLVAVHIACKAIQNGECDLAIAGGVKLNLLPLEDNIKLGIESSDYRARSFDDSSDGTGMGEGVAAILLKPLHVALKDRDNIYAVIKGSAINQDGFSVGITAPNVKAQTELIVDAWKNSGIDPETISYIEAHGTGTKLGDPIEVEGIQESFKRYTTKEHFCAISSVKTNIGHLFEAAGIAGLLKVVMSLKYKELAPNIHFKNPNRHINLGSSSVYVNDKLIKWETNGYPRRAGVSSFGFSGTNCHIVLEEAPEVNTNCGENTICIFTLSAKNEKALRDLVEGYKKVVECGQSLILEDLCYTANTGRGHLNYRLAMVVKSQDDLKEKINAVLRSDFMNMEDLSIYFNRHSVVTDKKIQETWEISNKMLEELTMAACEKLEEHLGQSKHDESILRAICSLYTRGANVPWGEFYANEKRYRVSLPSYPFEKKRCWVETIQKKVENANADYLHPLLGKRMVKSFKQQIYSARFGKEKLWVFDDHIVMNNRVLPGTAYLEMAYQAGKEYFGVNTIEIKDINFISPLIIPDFADIEVQTIINEKEDYIDFIITSRLMDGNDLSDEWIEHASGKIYKAYTNDIQNFDLGEIEKDYSKKEQAIDLRSLTAGFIDFGTRWLNSCNIKHGDNKVMAHVALQPEYKEDLSTYFLHPSLLDIAVNAYSFTLGERYLPIAYRSVKIYKPMPDKLYSTISKTSQHNNADDKISYDIILFDLSGSVIMKIEDYTIKKVTDVSSLAQNANLFHKVRWTPKGLDAKEQKYFEGTVIAFINKSGFSREMIKSLRNMGANVIEVEFGIKFDKITDNKYVISGIEHDYKELFDDIKHQKPRLVVHLASIGSCDRLGSLQQIDENLRYGLYCLFHLTNVLVKSKLDYGIDVVLVSDYVDEVTGKESKITPLNASLFGFSASINSEYPSINCKCIDIDEQTTSNSIFLELMQKENTAKVAYREDKRFVGEIASSNLEDFEDEQFNIKQSGVYIVTGGTGGMGLEFSKYLMTKNPANIALLSRSKLPSKTEWSKIIAASEDKKLCNKLTMLQEIEKSGGKIDIYSVDISNYDQMAEILDELREKYGNINGVIHSAGVAGAGFILDKDEETLNAVIKPKIHGTWVLDELTKSDKIDFFIMFSSIVTLIGLPGQAEYTAANSFLDSFSSYRRMNGEKALSINWTAWKDTGMAFEFGTNMDTAFKAISTPLAIGAFDRVMNKGIGRIIIGELNPNSNFQKYMLFELSDSLKNKYERTKRYEELSNTKSDFTSNVKLKGKTDDSYTEVEKKLGSIWGEVMGFNEINVYDDLYDLGGDSIIASKLVNRINKHLDADISIIDILENATIEELAKFLEEQKVGEVEISSTFSRIKAASEKEYYPLSFEQKRLYILYQLAPKSTSYNLPVVMRIDGLLDVTRIEVALNQLAKRHSSIRTYFELIDGNPVEKIKDNILVKLDCIKVDESEIQIKINEFIRPFDLSKPPLFRAKLLQLDNCSHIFMFDIHHIIADGPSVGILFKDIFAILQGRNIPETGIQYRDYIEWQMESINSDKIKAQENFWLNVFKDEIQVLNLPYDFERPYIQSYEGNKIRFFVDKELTAKLKRVFANHNVTLYMILLAAYNVMLSKYSGQEDIVVGSPVTGRHHQDLENMVGMFINTLPIRNQPLGSKPFNDFLDEVRRNSLQVFENQNYRFEDLVEKLNVKRDLSRNALFDVMFVLQNADKDIEITNVGAPKIELEIGELRIKTCEFDNNVSKYDLTYEAVERDGEIAFYVEYSTKLFKKETVESMAEHYINILEKVVDNPEICLSEIEILTEKEKKQIVSEFNNTKVEYPCDKTIHQLFEEQVDRTPDYIALAFGEKKLTYKELNIKANQLARTLREMGVGKDNIIGIMVERSFEMIVAILGVLKAGGAYLPIDPEYPLERIEYLLQNSGSGILITQAKLLKRAMFEGSTIDIDDENLYKQDGSNLKNINEPKDLAYVIYTSGSTGNPKGVMLEHKSVINFITGMVDVINFDVGKTILNLTTISFDIFVLETLLPLSRGMNVVIANENEQVDSKALSDVIVNNKVEMLQITPSRLKLLMSGVNELECLKGLKELMVGGEAFPEELLDQIRKLSCCRIYNMYGPTETTVWSTVREVTKAERIDIGKPIANTQIYILDSMKKIQPIGIYGELCISGDGLARGYLHNKELTQERFIINPLNPAERMYCTGDLARWLYNGNIEFLGRKDHQVKIRGYRIELGEIESQLLKHDKIREVVAIVNQDASKEKYICAYYVSDSSITVSELRNFLLKTLPNYMVPTFFSRLEKMPLTENGKIDRKKLPSPDTNIYIGIECIAPRNELEQTLVDIWREVLLIKDEIGVNHNFFDMGGNSLQVVKLINMISKNLNVTISVEEIFMNQTIEELAKSILQKKQFDNKFSEIQLELYNEFGNKCFIERYLVKSELYIVLYADDAIDIILEFIEEKYSANYLPNYIRPLNNYTKGDNALEFKSDVELFKRIGLDEEIFEQNQLNEKITKIVNKQAKSLKDSICSRKVIDKYECMYMQKYHLKNELKNLFIVDIKVTSETKLDKIEKALVMTINSNPILRTGTIKESGTYFFKQYDKINNLSIHAMDVTRYSAEDFNAIVKTISTIEENNFQVNENSNDILFSIFVLKRNEIEFHIMLYIHHIIFDGASRNLIVKNFHENLSYIMSSMESPKEISGNTLYKDYINLIKESTDVHKIIDYVKSDEFIEIYNGLSLLRDKGIYNKESLVFSKPIILEYEFDFNKDYGIDRGDNPEAIALYLAMNIFRCVFKSDKLVVKTMNNVRDFGENSFSNVVGDFHMQIPILFDVNEALGVDYYFNKLNSAREELLIKKAIHLGYVAYENHYSDLPESKVLYDLLKNTILRFNFIGEVQDIYVELLKNTKEDIGSIQGAYEAFCYTYKGKICVLLLNGLPVESASAIKQLGSNLLL